MFLMKLLSMEKLSLVMIYYSDIHLQEKIMYIKHKICSPFKLASLKNGASKK